MGLSAKKCRQVLDKIDNVVSNWIEYAEKSGINEKTAKAIEDVIISVNNEKNEELER